jgi:hypothetical protein
MGRLVETRPFRASFRLADKETERLSAGEDPEKVLRRLKRVLDLQIKVFGVDGGPTAKARFQVAMQLEKMGRLAEARVFLNEVVAAYSRNRGADDRYTLEYEEWLAANLMKSGLMDQARPLMMHVCDVRSRTLGPDDDGTKRARRRLAAIDRGQDR